MSTKSSILEKSEIFSQAKDYYTKILNVITDIESGMTEAAACRKHNFPVSSFRDATLCRKKFLSGVKPLEAFELYKEPSWKLYEDIFGETLTLQTLPKLPIDLDKTLLDVMSETLSDKQYAAIDAIYFKMLSYEEAASRLKVTSKAVRSLVAISLRNLRMPKCSTRIFYGDEFLSELDRLRLAYEPEIADNEPESDSYLDASIENLEISARVYNCLRRAGVKNVRDVKNLIDKGILWKLRNLGSKGVSEAMIAVNRYIEREYANLRKSKN